MLGKLPPSMAEVMCASNLIAVNKKDGGIRPIAVGDTLRRVVGKTLHTEEVKTQLSALRPRQCGVGVPYACELVGMGVQAIANSKPDGRWVLLQVDMANAFNSVSRMSMLENCLAKVSASYNWLSWCYRTACPLYTQGALLTQDRGSPGRRDGPARIRAWPRGCPRQMRTP